MPRAWRSALILWLCAVLSAHGGVTPADYERAISLAARTNGTIYRNSFKVRWLEDGRLTYSIQTDAETREWVLVDPPSGKITRARDAAALGIPEATAAKQGTNVRRSRTSDESMDLRIINRRTDTVELFWLDTAGRRQTYGQIKPGDDKRQHTFAGHAWLVTDLDGHELTRFEAQPDATEVVITQDTKPSPPPVENERRSSRSGNASPQKHWEVKFEGNQVLVQDTVTGETTPLTTDGSAVQPYRGPAVWSPDGETFVALSVHAAPGHQVTTVQSSPPDQIQPKVRTIEYLKPGDELPKPHAVIFRPSDHFVQHVADPLYPNPFTPDGVLPIRWSPKSDEFYFDYNQRGHQLYRILAVNAQTGDVRIVLEETSHSFIDYTGKTWRRWLPETGELLWMSERDGWNHLWLYDVATGTVKNQVTTGEWVVRDVLYVDEEKRSILFMANGVARTQDPYQQHLCRVNFDGTGFQQLTSADGNHAVEFSPDRRFFIDRWSRVDQPPIAELHRTDDGALLCELERADATPMLAAGWSVPERFVAKGRDGKTDIFGLIIKPSNFDPAKKYPVLEEVYAGPQGAFVAKDFGRLPRQHALAELGFIVVQADGMGTNYRGKAFHEVSWKNLQDAGFPDRIQWIKAAAATRPWMDLSRVGIYGGSAGGQNAMRALLDHHDFYQAAFADCGCHDNRMDKIWWNEQWLGWPLDDAYTKSSNVVDASRLQGDLMLSVGELDSNVDPSSTMQVVNALEKANKNFELLVITNSNHGAAESPYGSRRRMEFFVHHLIDGHPDSGATP